MTVTLVDVLAAARARCAPLVGELAGYLVLGVADQVAVAPRRVVAADVTLGPDGAVALVGGRAASERAAEAALRALLKQLLVPASSASPALSRASRGACGRGVGALVRELEASLIPVNRAAGKRAATRLYRETKRALDDGVLKGVREEVDQSPCVDPESFEPPEASVELTADQDLTAERGGAASPAQARPASHQCAPDVAADGVDPLEQLALEEQQDELHVEVVFESTAPPPVQAAELPAARQLSAPGYADGDVEPARQQVEPPRQQLAPVEEDVTRPEPVVRRAAQRFVPDTSSGPDVGSGAHSAGGPIDSDVALTPPLGSIAALESGAAPDVRYRSVPEPVAEFLDAEHTDPMYQGEYLEISESLGNYALELGLEESGIHVSDPAHSSDPADVLEPGPAVHAHELGEEAWIASSPMAEAGDGGPASDPGSPRRDFVMESPPWAPNATAASYPHTHAEGRQLRNPEWAWPDLSPVPPASQLAFAPAVTSPGDSMPGAAQAVPVANPTVVMRGQVSAEEAFPSEDGWDVPVLEVAAAAALRAAAASSRFPPRQSQVNELLARFSVADQREDGDVCRDLKRMAGLDLTPLPGTRLGEE